MKAELRITYASSPRASRPLPLLVQGSELYQSCQRSFPTRNCSTAVEALTAVLKFCYDRYNRENKESLDMILG